MAEESGSDVAGPETWTAVDAYLADLLGAEDPVLLEAIARSEDEGLPAIQVSALQGKLLSLLARMVGARRILEVGTLGGYSTIWLARALRDDGRLISLEIDPHHAAVARANLDRAGVAERVEVRVGRAAESLRLLVAENAGPFDLIFLDADKPSNAEYLELALRLSRTGTVIIGDNVVRNGGILDPYSSDPSIQGTRRFHELLASDPRVDATVVQTVGAKGYDGFSLAVVLGSDAA
jgi:predicted O-methyltransferase YrrM